MASKEPIHGSKASDTNRRPGCVQRDFRGITVRPEGTDVLAGASADASAIGAVIAERLSQTPLRIDAGRGETIHGAAHERWGKGLRAEELLPLLKNRGLTPEENILAIRHVIGRFAEGDIAHAPGADLGRVFKRMLAETRARAEAFKTTVADGAFDLAFEPIVDLATGAPSHYEVLTRFQPGQSPAETIRFAEDLGLTDAFDLAVALKTFDLLERNSKIDAAVAINLSGRSIAHPASFSMLARLLARKGTLAKRMLIEVTESAPMRNLKAAEKAIQRLRAMGYRVGIDDFGAGAASLRYLHGFTLDFVKVDGTLIQRIGQAPREDALLKAILSTCAELRIETIAEWIDNVKKFQRCREVGFHFGQGRYFGASMAALPNPTSRSGRDGSPAHTQAPLSASVDGKGSSGAPKSGKLPAQFSGQAHMCSDRPRERPHLAFGRDRSTHAASRRSRRTGPADHAR